MGDNMLRRKMGSVNVSKELELRRIAEEKEESRRAEERAEQVRLLLERGRVREEQEEREALVFAAGERDFLQQVREGVASPALSGFVSSEFGDATYAGPMDRQTRMELEGDPLSSPGSDSSREGACSKAIASSRAKPLTPGTAHQAHKGRRAELRSELWGLRGGKAGLFPADQLSVEDGGLLTNTRSVFAFALCCLMEK